MHHFCMDRHNGYINHLFLDWSVRAVGIKELWTLSWHKNFDTRGVWTKAGGVQPAHWPEWMRGVQRLLKGSDTDAEGRAPDLLD